MHLRCLQFSDTQPDNGCPALTLSASPSRLGASTHALELAPLAGATLRGPRAPGQLLGRSLPHLVDR